MMRHASRRFFSTYVQLLCVHSCSLSLSLFLFLYCRLRIYRVQRQCLTSYTRKLCLFFSSLLSLLQSTPCKHPVIVLQDVAFSDLHALVEFIYHGEVNVHQRSLSSFLKTAEVLRVSGLTQQADQTDRDEVRCIPLAISLSLCRSSIITVRPYVITTRLYTVRRANWLYFACYLW